MRRTLSLICWLLVGALALFTVPLRSPSGTASVNAAPENATKGGAQSKASGQAKSDGKGKSKSTAKAGRLRAGRLKVGRRRKSRRRGRRRRTRISSRS